MKRLIGLAAALAAAGIFILPAGALPAKPGSKKFASFAVPAHLKKAVARRLEELEKVRVGVGFFQDLNFPENQPAGGSGIDYSEQVLAGIGESGLFQGPNLMISNAPDDPGVDYIVGSQWISAEAIRFFIKKPGKAAFELEETLDMPEGWGAGGKDAGERRQLLMRQFGCLLGYRLAALALNLQ